MLSFLFWNIHKQPLAHRISRLARAHDVDVVMLAESTLAPNALTAELNRDGLANYSFQPSDRDKIQFFSRPTVGNVIEQFVDSPGSITARRVELPGDASLLVVVVHLPSKLNWSVATQAMHCVEVSRDIRLVENDVGHSRTIVVGDFNMHPFDVGVVGAQGFNAVLTPP